MSNYLSKRRYSKPPIRRGIGAPAVIVAAMIVVIVVAMGFLSFSSQPPASSSTTQGSSSSSFSTASQGLSSTAYSSVSPQGLQLQIILNTTAIQATGALTAQVYLYNTLSTNASLNPDFTANPNIAAWDNFDAPCGLSPVTHTFGFAIFRGHYTAANISLVGTPMMLMPPVAIGCPNRFYNQAYIQNIEFAPHSTIATISANASFSSDFKPQTIRMQLNATTGSCTTSPYKYNGTTTVNGVTTTSSGTDLAWGCGPEGRNFPSGYWTMPANGTYISIDSHSNSTITQGLNALYNNYFHPFTTGSYTIVAEDLWNQTAFAYFQLL